MIERKIMDMKGDGSSQPRPLAAASSSASIRAISSGSASETMPPRGRGIEAKTFPRLTAVCPPPISTTCLTACSTSSEEDPIERMLLSSGETDDASAPSEMPKPLMNATAMFPVLLCLSTAAT